MIRSFCGPHSRSQRFLCTLLSFQSIGQVRLSRCGMQCRTRHSVPASLPALHPFLVGVRLYFMPRSCLGRWRPFSARSRSASVSVGTWISSLCAQPRKHSGLKRAFPPNPSVRWHDRPKVYVPIAAALLTLFAPAFFVSATSVMCDVTLLAFYVWSIELWIRGLDQKRWWLLALAMLFVSAAVLTKYFGITLLPLLAVYT